MRHGRRGSLWYANSRPGCCLYAKKTRGRLLEDQQKRCGKEEDEDLDVTVALGDLVGSSRASSRLREKAGRSLVDTITNHARVDDGISRLNLSVTAVEGTLDITFEDKENCSSNLLRDVRPIGLENKLTPSNRRGAAFHGEPYLGKQQRRISKSRRRKVKNAMKDTTKRMLRKSNTPLRRSSRKKTPVETGRSRRM